MSAFEIILEDGEVLSFEKGHLQFAVKIHILLMTECTYMEVEEGPAFETWGGGPKISKSHQQKLNGLSIAYDITL